MINHMYYTITLINIFNGYISNRTAFIFNGNFFTFHHHP